MKKVLAIVTMALWCALAIYLQVHYLKPGITSSERCIVAVCVIPFYIVLFIASIKNLKKLHKKK